MVGEIAASDPDTQAVIPARRIAKEVLGTWDTLVGGEYTPPTCPSEGTMVQLLEAVNYAAGSPEEGRYPRFNVTIVQAGRNMRGVWRLTHPRPLSVSELRRLIPATDSRKSAVHVEWHEDEMPKIVGIVDMGTSWHRSRLGLAYGYEVPDAMLIEVERPNRLHVYQGPYRVLSFSDGVIDAVDGIEVISFLHGPTNGGLSAMDPLIEAPEDEPPREYKSFEFIALWNCFAAIVNSIAMAGHGGTLLVLPDREGVDSELLRVKYSMTDRSTTDAFLDFINARHLSANLHHLAHVGKRVTEEEKALLDAR